jgi:hypothetical protein
MMLGAKLYENIRILTHNKSLAGDLTRKPLDRTSHLVYLTDIRQYKIN